MTRGGEDSAMTRATARSLARRVESQMLCGGGTVSNEETTLFCRCIGNQRAVEQGAQRVSFSAGCPTTSKDCMRT